MEMERSGTSVLNELMALMRIRKIMRAVKPDIVHLISIKPTIYGGLICRLMGMDNVLISVSGLGYVYIGDELKTRMIRYLTSLLYRVAIKKGSFRVIFQNTDDLRVFLEMKAIRRRDAVMIKGSGVDLLEYRPSPEPEGVPIAMLVSRLLVDKGVREFVDAARILKKRKFPVRMVLVGGCDPGNPKTLREDEIDEWAASGLIEKWGFRESVAAEMRKANIIVLPSYREGMPKTLLEAAASARAVVTTDVPGCRDAIVPGVTGSLVPPRDPAGLADAIAGLCSNAELRRAMGRAGRGLAEREYDLNAVIDTHFSIYSDMMGHAS